MQLKKYTERNTLQHEQNNAPFGKCLIVWSLYIYALKPKTLIKIDLLENTHESGLSSSILNTLLTLNEWQKNDATSR